MSARIHIAFLASALFACGASPSSNDAGENDSGMRIDSGSTDAGTDAGVDAGLNISVEVEPNDGSSATALNAIVVPAQVTGVCDPQSDIDIFTTNFGAGQFWDVTLDSLGSSYAPHLAIHDVANKQTTYSLRAIEGVPPGVGGRATFEFFSPFAAGYALFVRDSRNVPKATSQNVGGPLFTYTLSITRSARTVTLISVPTTSSVVNQLSHRYGIGVYRFVILNNPKDLTIWVRAKTKAVPSDLDTFASLYRVGTGAIYQADDFSASNTDSQFHGTYAPDTYYLVVNNVNEAANDFTYEISATSP